MAGFLRAYLPITPQKHGPDPREHARGNLVDDLHVRTERRMRPVSLSDSDSRDARTPPGAGTDDAQAARGARTHAQQQGSHTHTWLPYLGVGAAQAHCGPEHALPEILLLALGQPRVLPRPAWRT
jgi:hypothetical protein